MKEFNYANKNNQIRREIVEDNNGKPIHDAEPLAKEEVGTNKFPQEGIVTANLLNLREKPSMKSKVLATLGKGDKVTIERIVNGDDNEKFYKVNASVVINGSTTMKYGYVVSKFCEIV